MFLPRVTYCVISIAEYSAARKELYVHFTTAIQTDLMSKIFESTQEIILNNSLIASGIVM